MNAISSLPLLDVWNASFDSMVITDEKGDILSLNRAATRLFSSSPSSLIGISIFELIPSEEFRKCIHMSKNMTGIAISFGTQQLIANLSCIHTLSNPPLFLLTFKNMTQTQQLQHQLQQMNEAKAMYDSILDQLEEGVVSIDQQGKIIFYNRKMGELDTMEPDAVRDKRLADVWSLDEETSTLLTCLRTGRVLNHRETHFTNNGKAVTTLSRTMPLYVGSKKVGAVEISKDITEQKHLTETIYQLQKQTSASTVPRVPTTEKSNTRYQFETIVYSSKEMGYMIEQARRSARSRSNILIAGETGTGKELIAQSIHNESPRKHKPFIAQNCAALPEALLEGLLFGTSVGSFTGAIDRAGLFEQAHGGTLLLDEINSMNPNLQAKLLRVLQERKIQRLGSSKVLDIDVRVIATMNEDPHDAIANEHLREDLYYRLGVVNIFIPPLRKRREDIPVLIDSFIQKHSIGLGVEVEGVDDDVFHFFLNYSWPGNVRQLEHTIEGSLNLVYDETMISFDHLPPDFKQKMNQLAEPTLSSQPSVHDFRGNLPEQIEHLERIMIEQALRDAKGNITKASEQLGIPRQNLNYKLKKYDLKNVRGMLS
ncbi:sigma 54-interacting transcriptional regulator [Brevibacillus choshinensis]|uniref:sigma 54-interacting transcriptional regulator n=1 Tax=Brevibacillus choshinensis TaxID=54911 RepID=UPI002E1C892B|nr:sigma 54-interacting transcriptional regulator [Brevibacillus choshinensis]MED4584424.1 sigma 54-interacting transcriptional regulator [Brevibacillus choshinensis]MED4784367.1 sigma 54-interacting transcriptional regulator [Brevibacillus choshinensis]